MSRWVAPPRGRHLALLQPGRTGGFAAWRTVLVFACLGITLLGGCASRGNRAPAVEPLPIQLLWPAPPDEPRFKYEWRLKTVRDLQPVKQEVSLRETLTGTNSGDQVTFARPGDIASRGGKTYVTDGQNKSVVVFDAPRRRVFQFGKRPPHTLQKPISVAVDSNGLVYVLDKGLKKVMVFDDMGLYLRELGESASLVNPASVAVNREGTRIYVVDRGSIDGDDHRVLVYDEKGTRVSELGPRGSGDGQFNIPLDVAVDGDGQIYVVDSGNFRIQVFTPDGKFKFAFGKVGNTIGQFSRPRSIAVSPEGNILVTDGVFNNIQIFSPSGEFLMPIGQYEINQDGPGRYGLIAGLAVDETKRIYVVDQYFNKVEVYRQLK